MFYTGHMLIKDIVLHMILHSSAQRRLKHNYNPELACLRKHVSARLMGVTDVLMARVTPAGTRGSRIPSLFVRCSFM